MPRNGSSVYSLPAGNPVIPGTVIATTWANTTLTDIATALTNSLSTDGSTATVSLAGKTMSGGTFSGPTVTGTLGLTGGQIAFPAVQVASANANTLDDYEEGTWTPTLTFATPGNLNVVYSTRTGQYTKIGDTVCISWAISTSTFTHTTAAGAVQISGFPFTAKTVTGHFWGGGVVSLAGLVPGTNAFLTVNIAAGQAIAQIFGMDTTSGAIGVMSTSNMATGVNKSNIATIVYQTST